MDKIFVSANDLLIDTFHLALSVEESGFQPSFILGIWRGGASVAMTVQEYFSYRGVETDQLAIRTETVGTNGSTRTVADSDSLDFLHTKLDSNSNLLVVEDIFASGHSVEAVISGLKERMGEEFPENVNVASLWYKPVANESGLEPDFYLRTTEKWVVFPHELTGLTNAEIEIGKPDIATLVSI